MEKGIDPERRCIPKMTATLPANPEELAESECVAAGIVGD